MLSALLIAALAASSAAPVPYADCLLGYIQPGLSDRAVQLVQEACAAKHNAAATAAQEAADAAAAKAKTARTK